MLFRSVNATPFAITSGLLAGLNTIDFKVNNAAAGYTGLRVRRLHSLGDLLPPGTPPFIVASPSSRLVQLGDTATFLVRANGSLPLSYQWFVGPDSLSGETGPTLSVLADFPDVAGSYSVRITSAFGSATSAPAVLTINQPPIAADNGAATSQGSALTLAVGKLLANDSDPDGNPLTVTAVSATSANNGAVTLAAGVVTYSPPAAFTGLDQFSYTISDGRGGSATAQVVVLVVSGSLPGANQVSLTPVGSGYRLRFAGIPGRSYDVQRAPAVDGPWATLATLVAPLHGIIEYLDANPPPGAAFYRTVAP